MARAKFYLGAVSLLFWASVVKAGENKPSFESTACKLLSDKFTSSNPWTTYPIVYDTINWGRLNVWTGVSSLPTSEFKCYSPKNSTNEIDLVFANFADRLEWTFYDMNKGLTYYGLTVKQQEDVKYRVTIKRKQEESYLECNTIDKVELISSKEMTPSVQTSCLECSASTIALINNQMNWLMKSQIEQQIIENLYWHISQLLSNQHFSATLTID